MAKLKVVHVITRLIVGGAQENTISSCALAEPGRFESLLVTGPQTGPEGELLSEARQAGVRLVVLPDLVREVSPWRDARALWALRRLLAQEQPDIVHTHSSKAGILGRAAARWLRTPAVVHTVHGWSFHDHMPAAVRASWIALERAAARWTDRLVVVTDRDRVKGLEVKIGRAHDYEVIRSGFDLRPFRAARTQRDAAQEELGFDRQTPVVGTVMRLTPQKDPVTWLRSAAIIASRAPDVRFLVVGDGTMRADVEQLIRQLDLVDRIVMTGLRRDVARLLSAMDVFVLTSRWEGLPRVVIQAMAVGVPVVAVAADGVAEVIADGLNGLVADIGDEAGVAGAVERLLADAHLRQAFSEAAARTVDEFDVQLMVRRLEQIYEEVASNRDRRSRHRQRW